MPVCRATLLLCMLSAAALLAQQDEYFVSAGVPIRFIQEGKGEPVVLLHGQTSSIENNWVNTGVVARLAKNHHVIAMDARGHGKSGKPHEANAYGVEMAHDVVRLLDHLKIARAHIVGYSMGAAINAKLLTLRPDRFLTAILAGGVGLRRWTSDDDRRFERVATELAGDMPFLNMLRGVLRGQNEAQIIERARWMRAQNDPLAIAASLRGQGSLVVSEHELLATTVPVMAIIGGDDEGVAEIRRLKTVMPRLAVAEIPGAVHHSFEERSAPRHPEFTSAINRFIRDRR
jgi:pimeloyl-ACP methyl ester carboxylesterase